MLQKIGCEGRCGLALALLPPENVFVECASCPEFCLAHPSNLDLGHVSELPIPALLKCGEGKGHPEQCGRTRLHAQENSTHIFLTPKFMFARDLLLPASVS